MELITGENDKGRRLDRILRKALPDHPLPLIHRLLRQKQVLVNGKPGKAQDRIESGDNITIKSLKKILEKDFTSEPEVRRRQDAENAKKEIKEDFLNLCEIKFKGKPVSWLDCGLLAVNKPQGLEVHGANSLDTMVNNYLKDKLPASLSFKPGPLHRLDRPSSGIVVFSTNLEGAHFFSSLMHERKIKKTYLAIVDGKLEKEETWQDELIRNKDEKKTYVTNKNGDGKIAITKVTPISVEDNFTLIKAEIITGRTHQIRAQAAAHGYPLTGDIKYGKKNNSGKSNFFLHAWKLEFLEYSIEAPLPD